MLIPKVCITIGVGKSLFFPFHLFSDKLLKDVWIIPKFLSGDGLREIDNC